MSSTLLVPPRTQSLSQDDIWLTLQTDIPRPTAGFVLISVSGSPTAGQFFRLVIQGEELEFTFATTPNNSGLQLSTNPGLTNTEYRDLLIDDLLGNEKIATQFKVTPDGSNNIRLTYQVIPGLIIQVVSNTVGIAATYFVASYDEQYLNLFAKIHVYRTQDIQPYVTLQAAYNSERKAQFNLAGLFTEQLELPSGNSMYPLNLLVRPYEIATPAGPTAYYVRHADSYGQPPTTERLKKAGPFHVVPGGSSGNSRRLWGSGVRYQLCHSYLIDQSLSQFWKPVTETQPDWVYWYVVNPFSGDDVLAQAVIYYSDGTTETIPVGNSPAMAIEAKKLYSFPSGPQQVGLNTAPSWATKTATRYEFQIVKSSGEVYTKIGYRLLPDCQDWSVIYLAYENGAGGIETVAMRGKSARGYNVSRKQFRRAKLPTTDLSRGEFAYYDSEAQQSYELPTGWYPKEYVRHLRQLLVADRVWMIDQEIATFIAVNVTTNSLELTTEDEDLHAVTFRIELANPDLNSHVL